jgi:hypothetical protein
MLAPNEILKRLLQNDVECVLVGGLAAIAYGVSTITQDVDICFSFHESNIQKLIISLEDISPRIRAGGGFESLNQYDTARLSRLDHLYLRTDLGELDILGRITGIGEFKEVKSHSMEIELFGYPCHILDIDHLIQAKEALGRPKDLQVVLELKAIRKKLRT